MITKDKVTAIFCIIDEFNKNLNTELENNFREFNKQVQIYLICS